jgi:hypothetical protein
MKKSLQKYGRLQVFLVLSASAVDSLMKQFPVKFMYNTLDGKLFPSVALVNQSSFD